MMIDIQNIINGEQFKISVKENIHMEPLMHESKEISFVGPVEVEFEIYKVDIRDLFITGTMDYEYADTCDRCLDTFNKKVHEKFSGQIIEKSENEDIYEDLIFFHEGGKFDIIEMLKTAILNNLPMKSLCSEDCKGICLKCGQNLNVKQCDCDTLVVDPRLSELEKFLK